MTKETDDHIIDTWCLHCGEDLEVRWNDALRDPNTRCPSCGKITKLDMFSFNAQRRTIEKLIKG